MCFIDSQQEKDVSTGTEEWPKNPATRISKYRSLTLKRSLKVGSERTHQLAVRVVNRKMLKSWKSTKKPNAEVPELLRCWTN